MLKQYFDFRNTRLSLSRPITSYDKVRRLISAVIRNRRIFIAKRRLKAIGGKEYLDIGCGPNAHDHCINLDYNWQPGVDLCWDVTRGLPLASGSVRGVFTEHCVEHLPFERIAFVLAEIRRVLIPGGLLRMIVPDGELYLTRYANVARGMSGDPLPYAEHDGSSGFYCPIMSVNRIFRSHGHLFIYDFACLRGLLERAGFDRVQKCSFRSGEDDALLLDTESRAVESLYVEAHSPS